MSTSKVTYTGDLSTEATHLKSGATIITDAPVDNNGLGRSFSPTDLVATALGSCMLIQVVLTMPANGYGDRERKVLAAAAHHCPVSNSLMEGTEAVTIKWLDDE